MEPLAQGLPRLPQPNERVYLSLHHRPNSFSVPYRPQTSAICHRRCLTIRSLPGGRSLAPGSQKLA